MKLATLLGVIVLYWYATRKTSDMVDWVAPDRAAEYLPLLAETEYRYGIPETLLARMADIESHFRPDIISGLVKSSAGAVGIMQIIPRFHPGIDATDPLQAIPYAGRYLRTLYNRFGSWPKAVAAYNWGPTNLADYLTGQITSLPKETRKYLLQIYGRDTV